MIDTSRSREDRWRSRERMVETMIVPPKGGAIIVRVDGRAFHTLTRRMEKPFDTRMTDAMDSAASAMAKAMPSVVATYTQSDEISAIIAIPEQDRPIRQEEVIPFAGRVQKLASVMASAAAAGFARSMPDAPGLAVFDGRAIKARSPEEVRDYLDWRIDDSRKNAISAAAVARFGHKSLLNVSTKRRAAMLEEEGITIAPDDLYGRLLRKVTVTRPTTFVRDGVTHTQICERNVWESVPATPENVDDLVRRLATQKGDEACGDEEEG